MKTWYLALGSVAIFMVACGGSSPAPETPASEEKEEKSETATPKQKVEEGPETPEQEKAEDKSEDKK